MTTDNIPVAEFVEESVELLQQMEEAALELDARPGDRALVDQLFRGMHTIKGGAAVVKRPDLADYAHRLEHLLDQVRGGHVSADKTVISTLLDAIDCVGLFVTGIQTGLPVDQARVDTSVQNVSALVGSANQLAHEVQATGEATPSELMSIDSNNSQAYLVTLKFHPQMPERGGDPLLLLKELAELGDCVIVAHPGNLPNIEEFDATRLYLWWSIKLTTSLSQSEIEQTLLFFKEGNELSVVPFDATPEETDTVEQAHKAQIAQAVAGAEDDVQSTPVGTSELTASVTGPVTGFKTTEPANIPSDSGRADGTAGKSIRVSIDRLERLQNLIGETVINQSRLIQLCEEAERLDPNFAGALNEFLEENSRSVRDLQDEIQAVRMVQVDTLFSRLRRVVRDYSVESNKEIRLRIEGGETELDKTVTDQLHGPLLHLIRNAMDHGIESSEERRQAAKDTAGTIWLRAFHRGGHVMVEVQDDGKGMDVQRIRQKGLDRGLIDESDELSDQQLLQLVFRPGFTTTDEVTDISGRGVGMDSVKRDIEALLGSIDIFSEPGRGTTLRMRLPLTLAIIDGMIVRVGSLTFIVPLLAVVEAIRPKADDIRKMKRDNELVEIRGEFLPLVRLHRQLNIDCEFADPADAVLLVLQHIDSKQCLMVDEIVDQRPVVIKNLDDNFVQVPGMTGASIMGDGKVSFILDVAAIAA
ncbi:MAG TPA: chemotaxis protein CheA [Arenicellales bacterium]|jgi:two-component system chemotaxis sensor kinase CheA|nr:chemotaxis protein CheA [Arenicellales bacterium]